MNGVFPLFSFAQQCRSLWTQMLLVLDWCWFFQASNRELLEESHAMQCCAVAFVNLRVRVRNACKADTVMVPEYTEDGGKKNLI